MKYKTKKHVAKANKHAFHDTFGQSKQQKINGPSKAYSSDAGALVGVITRDGIPVDLEGGAVVSKDRGAKPTFTKGRSAAVLPRLGLGAGLDGIHDGSRWVSC